MMLYPESWLLRLLTLQTNFNSLTLSRSFMNLTNFSIFVPRFQMIPRILSNHTFARFFVVFHLIIYWYIYIYFPKNLNSIPLNHQVVHFGWAKQRTVNHCRSARIAVLHGAWNAGRGRLRLSSRHVTWRFKGHVLRGRGPRGLGNLHSWEGLTYLMTVWWMFDMMCHTHAYI